MQSCHLHLLSFQPRVMKRKQSAHAARHARINILFRSPPFTGYPLEPVLALHPAFAECNLGGKEDIENWVKEEIFGGLRRR